MARNDDFKSMLFDMLVNFFYVDENRAANIIKNGEYRVYEDWADYGRSVFYSEFGGNDIPEYIESALEEYMDWEGFGESQAFDGMDEVCFEVGDKVVYCYYL